MFLAHFAVGFAAKKLAPTTPLPLLLGASQLVDLLWPLLLLLGIETVAISPGDTPVTPLAFTSYPYTHSLLMSVVWSLLAGGIVYALRRNAREAGLVAACVGSHWLLDLISHRPDLPLTPWGETRAGFGLWYSPVLTYLAEFSLLAAGVAWYRSVASPDALRRAWFLVAALAFFYLMNILGPPPPSPGTIAVAGNSMWLFVVWAWWIERPRRV